MDPVTEWRTSVRIVEYPERCASCDAATLIEVGLTEARSEVFITMRRSPSSTRSSWFHWLGAP